MNIRWCPTQFQELVPGTDVRVHVVGPEVFASAIDSNVVDYRYARRTAGGEVEMSPIELRGDVRDACVSMVRSMGLELVGVDLKLAPGGAIVCFEVNPSRHDESSR